MSPGEPGAAVIRVAVATRVRLYREGLAESLERYGRLHVVARAGSPDETLAVVARHAPDGVILDLGLCETRPLVREILALAPAAKIIALAVDEQNEDAVLACASAGVMGWVGTEASVEDLARVLEHVVRGELMCSARQAALLLGRVAELTAGPAAAAPLPLTAREAEIGALLAAGRSNKAIARSLGIGLPTVKNHVHNILTKLDVRTRAEAGARYRRPGRAPDGATRATGVEGRSGSREPDPRLDPAREDHRQDGRAGAPAALHLETRRAASRHPGSRAAAPSPTSSSSARPAGARTNESI